MMVGANSETLECWEAGGEGVGLAAALGEAVAVEAVGPQEVDTVTATVGSVEAMEEKASAQGGTLAEEGRVATAWHL